MITLSNFENYALPQIWERGISYYRQGAVRNLEEDSPEEWVATVLGTEDYTVEVTLEDDKVMDYICDCPYEGDNDQRKEKDGKIFYPGRRDGE